ncbi:MAG: zinc ribbon domain-containing protein [Gemmatimonadaceae bacterium]
MPYTNCSACGAKALVGATRCPRCQAPFVSYEFGGERVATVNCPNCGVQRPVAIGVCPNCLMSTAPSGRRLVRGLMLTGVGIAIILAVGYLISRRTEKMKSASIPAVSVADTGLPTEATSPIDSTALIAADSSERAAPASIAPIPTSIPAPAPAAVAAAPRSATTADATKSVSPNPAAPVPAPPPSVAVPDTGRWEFATANTWVRVRSAPTRESETLRMVDSAQRVRLGPSMNGWRSIRVGVDRGWVDPRLFTVLPAPRP